MRNSRTISLLLGLLLPGSELLFDETLDFFTRGRLALHTGDVCRWVKGVEGNRESIKSLESFMRLTLLFSVPAFEVFTD